MTSIPAVPATAPVPENPASSTASSTEPPAPASASESTRGPDPAWVRPSLALLLVGTAIAYFWNLSINGWGNSFYAAAVQAGTMSWKAFFFGSFDPGNYITVDKPPVSLWIMELSGRIFGFGSWSMLAPEVLLGVGAVGLLYLTVRRVWGPAAALLAGLALAVTPVAGLMFRFNNPDAALTFFMVAAAYAMTRAVEHASARWLVVTGALMGVAFLTKELQALLVVPGLALAYLVSAPVGWLKRVGHLLVAGATMAVTGLWWPVLVDLVPASSRPYIGGSTGNSVLELALGYNGLGRLTGNEAGGGGGARGGGPADSGAGFGAVERFRGGGGGAGGMFSGQAGIDRLFNGEFGGFIAWLIPAAIIGLVAAAWLTRRAGRTDPRRASLVLWTGWFVVTAAVFSFSQGIIHTYYAVALAPAVAALAAMALPALWHRRAEPVGRVSLALVSAATAGTAYLLLDRAPAWTPWLKWVVLAAGLLAALGLLVAGFRPGRFAARLVAGVGALAVLAGLAAPAAWSAATIGRAQSGSLPSTGPAQAQEAGFRRAGGNLGAIPGGAPGGEEFGGAGTRREGGPGGGADDAESGGGGGFAGGGGFGGGGFGGGGTVDAATVTLLRQSPATYTWAASATSSNEAAPLQLGSGRAVMSLGGFGGSDPAITLDTFKTYVAQHRVHYYVTSGAGGVGGRGGGAGFGGRENGVAAIGTWVAATFTATAVGSSTVYDLTQR